MGAVKAAYWDDLVHTNDDDMAMCELAHDIEGHTEHELRETLAEAIQVLGRQRVDQIISEEVR